MEKMPITRAGFTRLKRELEVLKTVSDEELEGELPDRGARLGRDHRRKIPKCESCRMKRRAATK